MKTRTVFLRKHKDYEAEKAVEVVVKGIKDKLPSIPLTVQEFEAFTKRVIVMTVELPDD
jgi:cell fate (sporulation/competence/biofilm development) regulator YmcA (YheA/YmcA/DUF963 family)